MKQTTYLVLLISSLLYFEVASDDSFLKMENLENYTVHLMKLFEVESPNPEFNTSTLIQNFFVRVNNFTADLAKLDVNLRFDRGQASFASYWNVPKHLDDDLDTVLAAAEDINEFFKSYYIDFMDGFQTKRLILAFIAKSIHPVPDSIYLMTARIKDAIFSSPLQTVENNFFDRISDKLNENFDQLCKGYSTRQQLLISFYSFIIKTQFRAFLMLTSAYKLQAILSNDTSSKYLVPIKQLRTYFLSKCNYYLTKMQPALKKASTEYYNCQGNFLIEFNIQQVHTIDLSPVTVDTKWNKVVTKVQLKVKDGMLGLALHDGTLLENGKILIQEWDSIIHSSKKLDDYPSFEKSQDHNETLNFHTIKQKFWNNISFLHTEVPENHVIIGANFEVIETQFEGYSKPSTILYFRLHYAKVDIETGKIDASNITYTKVWDKDDPELQRHVEITEKQTFQKNRDASYEQVLVNTSNPKPVHRWRRKPSMGSHIDANVITVDPHLPITSLGLWKNDYFKYCDYLSLKISTMDISSRINPHGQLYESKYSVRKFVFE